MTTLETTVRETGRWARDLDVDVPPERIDREMQSALRGYQKRLEIPGFRKGKVPLRLIQQRYGPSIRSGVIEDLLPEIMREAAQQTGLRPAGTPRITRLDESEAGGLSFTASIDIWPEVDVQGHEGLRATRLTHGVSDDEVEEQLQQLQRQHASERSVERGLARGDVLIADLQRLDEGGVPIIGDRYEERYFLIGDDNAPSPEFEEALIGIEAGAERKVRFQYREDLPNEELAGTRAHFAVSAREIRERTLPDLDDEFAREVGDRFEGLEQLRDHLRSQLDERWNYLARQKLRSDLLEGLHRANEVELSDSLVDNYLESMRRERERQEDGQEPGEPTAEEREDAVKRLKTFLIMEGLRKKVSVEVTDEEFEGYLADRSRQLGMQLDKLKRSPRAADLRRDLEEDKIFAYLEEHAIVEERAV